MNTHFSRLCSLLAPLYGEGEARAIAFLVLEEAFGVGRTSVYADKVRDFSEEEEQRYLNICQRLAAFEPVQYVLGSAGFAGRPFRVAPGVLIPRPETEGLVDLGAAVLEALRAAGQEHPRVFDGGTGSGCIAVSLALRCPWAEVEACDLSSDALAVARDNAARLAATVRFRRQDLLAPWPRRPPYDLIVSNPPYVMEREREEMAPNVLRFEPATALFVPDADPLRFYRALAEAAAAGSLAPGGTLAVEINRALGPETAALFESLGLRGAEIHADCFGNPRFVSARR